MSCVEGIAHQWCAYTHWSIWIVNHGHIKWDTHSELMILGIFIDHSLVESWVKPVCWSLYIQQSSWFMGASHWASWRPQFYWISTMDISSQSMQCWKIYYEKNYFVFCQVWGIDEAITLFQKEGVDSPCARPSVTSTKRNHTPSGMATSMAISSDKNRYVIELNSKGSDSQSKDSTGTHRTGITSASETSINRTGTSGVDGTPATPEVHSYIMVCSSNDRLELTITPTGIATIKEYVEVDWFVWCDGQQWGLPTGN